MYFINPFMSSVFSRTFSIVMVLLTPLLGEFDSQIKRQMFVTYKMLSKSILPEASALPYTTAGPKCRPGSRFSHSLVAAASSFEHLADKVSGMALAIALAALWPCSARIFLPPTVSFINLSRFITRA